MINRKFNLSLRDLSDSHGSIHIFQTDINHRLVNCNARQAKTFRQLLSEKNANFVGLSISDLYSYNTSKAEILCNENELVMRSGASHTFKSVLTIPGIAKIKILTTKFSNYEPGNKRTGVFGIGYFMSEYSLSKLEEYSLTPRENECLEHLLDLKTSSSIAEELNISARTIDDHVDNLKGKFQCNTRLELVSKAEKLGIITRYL